MDGSLKSSIAILFILLFCNIETHAQSKFLTLKECYQLAKDNYPLIKKLNLIEKTETLDLENAGKGFFPQITFSGQATYQSETIDYSSILGNMPSINVPEFSKDQYKIQGEISQLLYDGGNIRNQKSTIEANAELQKQNLEANLYSLKDRINSIFFSILLMEAQLNQNGINKESLKVQAKKTEASLKNGVAFRSNLDEINAEIVNIDMQSTEYQANRKAYLKLLSIFVGKELSEDSKLEIPSSDAAQTSINRPEIKAYDLQKNLINIQEKQLKTDYLPKVSLFFQGAYGRPTLNSIENQFGPWYVTGIKFSWPLNSLYTLSNKRKTLDFNRQMIDADKETFLFNTKLDLSQQDEQVKKYMELLEQDDKVIALRQSIKKSAEAQLNNGVIMVYEYIQKVNAENLAKQTQILHQIQLLHAQYNQKYISGN